MSFDVDWFKRFVATKHELEDLEAKAKAKKAELVAMMDVGIGKLIESGIASVPLVIDGRGEFLVAPARTLSLNRKPDVSAENAIAALRAADLGWMIHETYPAATLSSWAREELERNNPLPDAVSAAFAVFTKDELRVTKRTKKESRSARAAKNLRAMQQGTNDGTESTDDSSDE